MRNEINHEIELAGKMMCVFGIFLTFLDSYLLDRDTIP